MVGKISNKYGFRIVCKYVCIDKDIAGTCVLIPAVNLTLGCTGVQFKKVYLHMDRSLIGARTSGKQANGWLSGCQALQRTRFMGTVNNRAGMSSAMARSLASLKQ